MNSLRGRAALAALAFASMLQPVLSQAPSAPAAATVATHGMNLPASGDFLLFWTPARITMAKAWLKANPGFVPRRDNPCSAALDNAFLYVVNGNQGAGRLAVNWVTTYQAAGILPTGQGGSDEGRWNGECTILAYNWIKPLLTGAQKQTLIARWNGYNDMWLAKPWGAPNMPDSNYYWGFLRNAFLWALASYNDTYTDAAGQTQRQIAEKLLDNALVTRWQGTQLPYLNKQAKGGVFPEGSHYGPYLIEYYGMMMAIADQFGRAMHNETNYFKESAFHIIYATTPKPAYGKRIDAPIYQVFTYGDVQDVNGSPPAASWDYASPMTLYANHWGSTTTGRFIRSWINIVKPANRTQAFVRATDAGAGTPGAPFTDLPTDYFAPGSGFLYSRDTWAAGPADKPTVMYLQAGEVTGSHAHLDAGSFQILRNDRWLSEEASGRAIQYTGLDGTGAIDSTDAGVHNVVLFNYLGKARDGSQQEGPPIIRRLESRPEYAYVVSDLSPAYHAKQPRYANAYAGSAVREFLHLKALDTLVVFDRLRSNAVTPMTAENVPKTFLLQTPNFPVAAGNVFTSKNGNEELRVVSLTAAVTGQGNERTTYRVVDESVNMKGSAGVIDPQFRLQVDTKGVRDSYQIHVLQAKSSGDADLAATLAETPAAFTITLAGGGRPDTVITFQKGMTSAGGAVTIGGQRIDLLAGVQPFTVTDNGPAWGK